MNRRTFVQLGLATTLGTPLFAALREQRLEDAADVLSRCTASGQVAAAALHVSQDKTSFTRIFGKAQTNDAMFLLGSISKPINMTALMTLFDQGAFKLDDPLNRFIPAFSGEGRERVTMRHLLTHVSGLPDQLAQNEAVRREHGDLSKFIELAVQTPLEFAPGSRYQYSSMGILLAAHVAELISKTDIRTLVDRAVFQPLNMQHSAQGLGRFSLEDMLTTQTDFGAKESGGGQPTAKDWDWNSPYWRKLGAPWGGTHSSAPDLGRFFSEFLFGNGAAVKPETARLMSTNNNPEGLAPRGLGFNVGLAAGGTGCSEKTFGHTGSTGTVAWADPATRTICVVLTTLPARAVSPHPYNLASAQVAAAAR